VSTSDDGEGENKENSGSEKRKARKRKATLGEAPTATAKRAKLQLGNLNVMPGAVLEEADDDAEIEVSNGGTESDAEVVDAEELETGNVCLASNVPCA
jgi:hypothetical protein